jgi:hypothetical protein
MTPRLDPEAEALRQMLAVLEGAKARPDPDGLLTPKGWRCWRGAKARPDPEGYWRGAKARPDPEGSKTWFLRANAGGVGVGSKGKT